MKKYLILTFSYLFISLLSHSQTADASWDFIGESADNQKYYIDLSSEIEAIDGTISFKKAWVKITEAKTTIKKGNKPFTYYNTFSVFLWEIKCDTKELRSTQFVTYSSKGTVIESGNDYGEFGRVVPGSMGEKILLKLCNTYQARNRN